jgi:hypothetical protein
MAEFHPKGIFCLEGEWTGDMRRRYSVEPVLTLVDEHLTDHPNRRHVRRDVATKDELRFYLERWRQRKFRTHPILYLAFHGEPGRILLSDLRKRDSRVTLTWVEEMLEGRCRGRILHFGACSTLDVHRSRLNTFLKKTGALAMSGYTQDVEWLRSAAFELLVLTEMQYGAPTVGGLHSIGKRILERSGGLAKEMGFFLKVREAGWKRAALK